MNRFQLIKTPEHLELHLTDEDAPGPVYVDFLSGVLAYRRRHGGGRSQLIAKAVGVKSKEMPSVLDVTAGLGRDAFVLALLGCSVVMCERNPVIRALLIDGLTRAQKADWFRALQFTLMEEDALSYFARITEKNRPDVIYIDPMFPESNKSALVKKEMRVLRAVVGDDLDAPRLLENALKIAKKRVVVKRARLAPTLTTQQPDLIFKGKSSRFDVYFVTAVTIFHHPPAGVFYPLL